MRVPFLHCRPPRYCKVLRHLDGCNWRQIFPAIEIQLRDEWKSNCPAFIDFLQKHSQYSLPPVGIGTIDSGRVFGQGVALSPDGQVIARDCAVDFRQADDHHWLMDTKKLRRPTVIRGSILVSASHMAQNYYHWLLEELPRILFGVQNRCFDNLLATPVEALDSLLDYLKVRPKVIPVSPITHYQADKLIVPNYLAPTGFPSTVTVQMLQDFGRLFSPEKRSDARWKRVYISRAAAQRRHVTNEAEVVEQLKEKGFTVVILEKEPLKEQIQIFRCAELIVAPHGAGLANLVFCQPGTRVIEFFNNGYVHHCFAQLAELAHLHYEAICSQPTEPVGHGFKESQHGIEVPIIDLVDSLAR